MHIPAFSSEPERQMRTPAVLEFSRHLVFVFVPFHIALADSFSPHPVGNDLWRVMQEIVCWEFSLGLQRTN